MRHKVFVIIFIFVAGIQTSCKESINELCGGKEPDKSLPWLKTKIEELNSSPFCYSISRSIYKNQTVFIQSNCDPNVNSIPSIYDCEGKQLELSVADYQSLNFTGTIEFIWKNR